MLYSGHHGNSAAWSPCLMTLSFQAISSENLFPHFIVVVAVNKYRLGSGVVLFQGRFYCCHYSVTLDQAVNDSSSQGVTIDLMSFFKRPLLVLDCAPQGNGDKFRGPILSLSQASEHIEHS